MPDDATQLLERITQDPEVMVGKPVIRGTRIPVDRIIAHLATSLDFDDLYAAYPELSPEDVRAALQFAHATLEGKCPSLQVRREPASTLA